MRDSLQDILFSPPIKLILGFQLAMGIMLICVGNDKVFMISSTLYEMTLIFLINLSYSTSIKASDIRISP